MSRKASIAQSLKALCEADGFGLEFFEVDILVGGSAHDLLSKEAQEAYIARIVEGEFDVVILSPPCGTWSRANWANTDGPAPCRDRFEPWASHGTAEDIDDERRRAMSSCTSASGRSGRPQNAKRRGFRVTSLMEHPEDLGRIRNGCATCVKHGSVPASTWQLPEVRGAYGEFESVSVAGHQCQFPNLSLIHI